MANSASRTLIIEEIARRGWGRESIGPKAHILKIIHPDGRTVLLRGTNSTRTSAIGHQIANFKHLTLDFVNACGYKAPEHVLVSNMEDALEFLAAQGRIVLKPIDGQQSEGVTVNITQPEELAAAFTLAKQFTKEDEVLLQQHIEGNLFRVLILDGKMVAATWRTGLTISGDGESTITELIEHLNLDPNRGEHANLGLKKINLATAAEFIGSERMNEVLPNGQDLVISSMDSIPGGGAVNVTDRVHADWQEFSIKMAAELGIFMAGFDFLCEDISQPMQDTYVPLLEVNAGPGLRIHEYPTTGAPVHVAPMLLDALFP